VLPDGDWDTNQYADRILRYMDEQGLEQIDLLGHSLGGRVKSVLPVGTPIEFGALRSQFKAETSSLPLEWIRGKLIKWLRVFVSLIQCSALV